MRRRYKAPTFGILRTTLETLLIPYDEGNLRRIAKECDLETSGMSAVKKIDFLEVIVGRMQAHFENLRAIEKRGGL